MQKFSGDETKLRTIYVMWIRQIKRYLRSKSRIIGSLGQPLLFLLAFGFGFGPIYAQAGQGNFIQFLAPGIIAMSVLFTAVFSGIEMIWDRQFGFLKEILVAPVSRTKIMIGRTLGGATVAFLQGVIIFLLSLIAGFRPNVAMLPFALLFLALIAILFTAVGTAIGSVLDDMHGFQLIMNFLLMPLFFLSGALFPLNNVPSGISMVTKLNPLTYGVDGLRGSLTGIIHFGFVIDFAVLSGCTVFFICLGSYLFSKIQI
jgi:ABC-2 type transport system permease protein